MGALTACASYPGDLSPEDPLDDEVAQSVSDRRSELFTLLKNCARVAPDDVYGFVRERLQQALSSSSTSFQVCTACCC